YTLLLAGVAFVILILGGLSLGCLAAFHEGRWLDEACVVTATLFTSLASFWVGLMLIEIFSVKFGLLPTFGFGYGDNLVLPAVTLALPGLGRVALVCRASVIG